MNRLDSALHYARLSLANPDTANSNLYLYYQNLASIALKKKDWRISAEAFDDMYRLYKKHTDGASLAVPMLRNQTAKYPG